MQKGAAAPPPAGAIPVTWNNTLNLAVSGANVRHSRAGYFCNGNSDQILNAANDTGFFQFQGSATSGWLYAAMYLMPVPTPAQGSVPNRAGIVGFNVQVFGYNATGVNVYKEGRAYATGVDPIAASDIVKFKFSAGKILMLLNGVIIYTSASVYSGDYTLYVVLDNESADQGLDNILYQS